MHDGKSLVGIAQPNYKNGRYSKGLPSLLGTRFASALTDPKLGELSAEIFLDWVSDSLFSSQTDA